MDGSFRFFLQCFSLRHLLVTICMEEGVGIGIEFRTSEWYLMRCCMAGHDMRTVSTLKHDTIDGNSDRPVVRC